MPFPKKGRVNIRLTGHRKQNGHHQYKQTANAVQGENLSSFEMHTKHEGLNTMSRENENVWLLEQVVNILAVLI